MLHLIIVFFLASNHSDLESANPVVQLNNEVDSDKSDDSGGCSIIESPPPNSVPNSHRRRKKNNEVSNHNLYF